MSEDATMPPLACAFTPVPASPPAPASVRARDDDPADARAAASHEARLNWLFRHTLRHHGVNPLLHLVPRRREGAGS